MGTLTRSSSKRGRADASASACFLCLFVVLITTQAAGIQGCVEHDKQAVLVVWRWGQDCLFCWGFSSKFKKQAREASRFFHTHLPPTPPHGWLVSDPLPLHTHTSQALITTEAADFFIPSQILPRPRQAHKHTLHELSPLSTSPHRPHSTPPQTPLRHKPWY